MIGYTPHELDLRAAAAAAPPMDFAAGFEALAAFLRKHPALHDRLPDRRHVSIPLKGTTSEERRAELHDIAREMGTAVDSDGLMPFAAVKFGPVVLVAHHNQAAFIAVQDAKREVSE